MAQKQRAGRHIRARTVEAIVDELTDSIDSMHVMCVRWDFTQVDPPTPDARPLFTRLEMMFARAVHFLCLLRGKISTASCTLPLIPAEVWSRVIFEVLPPVSHFAYHDGSGTPIVRLAPLPTVPVTGAPVDILQLLTFQDRTRQKELCRAWAGRGRSVGADTPRGGRGRDENAEADGGIEEVS